MCICGRSFGAVTRSVPLEIGAPHLSDECYECDSNLSPSVSNNYKNAGYKNAQTAAQRVRPHMRPRSARTPPGRRRRGACATCSWRTTATPIAKLAALGLPKRPYLPYLFAELKSARKTESFDV